MKRDGPETGACARARRWLYRTDLAGVSVVPARGAKPRGEIIGLRRAPLPARRPAHGSGRMLHVRRRPRSQNPRRQAHRAAPARCCHRPMGREEACLEIPAGSSLMAWRRLARRPRPCRRRPSGEKGGVGPSITGENRPPSNALAARPFCMPSTTKMSSAKTACQRSRFRARRAAKACPGRRLLRGIITSPDRSAVCPGPRGSRMIAKAWSRCNAEQKGIKLKILRKAATYSACAFHSVPRPGKSGIRAPSRPSWR